MSATIFPTFFSSSLSRPAALALALPRPIPHRSRFLAGPGGCLENGME